MLAYIPYMDPMGYVGKYMEKMVLTKCQSHESP